MTSDSDRSIEEDPLLTSTRNDSEGENETTQQTDDDDDDPKTRKGSFWRRLDMIPTQRDRISSGLVLVSRVGSWSDVVVARKAYRTKAKRPMIFELER
jgi:hypothetical protein